MQAKKLMKIYGIVLRKAQALVLAGYYTPRKIKAASDEQLLEVNGIGEAALAKLRRY